MPRPVGVLLLLLVAGLALLWCWSRFAGESRSEAIGPSAASAEEPALPDDIELLPPPVETTDQSRRLVAGADIAAKQPVAEHEVQAASGFAYHGLVLERDSGRPIPAVAVVMDIRQHEHSVFTDQDGRFELRNLLNDDFDLRLQKSGWTEVRGRVERGHSSALDANVFLLGRTASLVGTVTTRAGERLAEAEVRLTAFREHLYQPPNPWLVAGFRPEPTTDLEWSALTDATGAYSIEDLPSGVPLLAMAVHEDARVATGWLEVDALASGERRQLDFVAASPTRLRGRVVDQNGDPAKQLTLWLAPATRAEERYLRWDFDKTECIAVTNGDGTYAFENVLPGAWLLGPAPSRDKGTLGGFFAALFGDDETDEKTRHGYAPWGTCLEVRLGELERELDLVAQHDLRITGSVVDHEGRPVSGAHVDARADSFGRVWSQSVRDGTFDIGPLCASAHDIQATCQGHGASERVTAFPGEPVILQLGPTGAGIRGVVTHRGKRVRGAAVTVSRVDVAKWTWAEHSTRTKEDGTFSFLSLAIGTYAVSAQTDDGLFGVVPDVRSPEGADAQAVEIELREPGRLRVRYLGEEPGVLLVVRSAGAFASLAATSRGGVSTLRAPVGAARIEIYRPGHGFDMSLVSKRDVVVRRDEVVEVELR